MGVIKKILTAIGVLVVAACAIILLCALNPGMTQSVAAMLYGTEHMDGILSGFLRDREADPEESEQTPARRPQIPAGTGQSADPQDAPAYQVVEETITVLPENVYGRSGYEPIQTQAQTVSTTEANVLVKGLTVGETGEDLDFDPVYYPYYAMLGDDQKAVYRQIYANAQAGNAAFAPVKKISSDALRDTFEAVFGDHPELFFVQTAYTEKYTQDKNVVEVDLSYYTIENDRETAKDIFGSRADQILEAARLLPDDYEKVRYVHDELLNRVEYNSGARMSQSAYSAMVDGQSVCAGYARSYQYLLQKLGIPCYYCTGSSGEDHAWNIVRLPDGYYNVDLTWDDTTPNTYDYFCKTDADYAGTHVRRGMSIYLPACNGTQYRNLETGAPNEDELGPRSVDAGTGTGYSPYDDPYINNEPTKPLVYEGGSADSGKTGNGTSGSGTSGSGTSGGTDQAPSAAGKTVEETLKELGLKNTDVCWTLTDYYNDCLKQLSAAGSGSVTFSNVVPATLYDKIEQEYGLGNYKAGYLTKALANLGMNRCQIQLQAQRLGGGYYRLYHNMDTWNEN